jgi:hypothetical protein
MNNSIPACADARTRDGLTRAADLAISDIRQDNEATLITASATWPLSLSVVSFQLSAFLSLLIAES